MRRITPLLAFTVATALLAAALFTSDAAEQPMPRDTPVSALIVAEGTIPRSGVGRLSAIRIIDQKKLAELAAFFPAYRDRPSSDRSGGWEAAYRIYFDHRGGECIRVTVSRSGESWT